MLRRILIAQIVPPQILVMVHLDSLAEYVLEDKIHRLQVLFDIDACLVTQRQGPVC
jgi:hypothetical protein